MPATEAQKRATTKWKSNNYTRIVVDVKPETKIMFKEKAEKRKMSLQGYIKWLVENDTIE